MKEDINYYDDTQTDVKGSGSKILIPRQAFAKQKRNMRRMHSNSILNELRLSQKINQGNFLLEQEKSLNRFQNARKNSLALIRSKKKMSDFNMDVNVGQSIHKQRLSQFFESSSKNIIPPIYSSHFSNLNEHSKRFQQLEPSNKKSKDDKQFVIKSPKKKMNNSQKKPKNLILSTINMKIRQIDIISRKFDKVNSFFIVDNDLSNKDYKKRCDQTSNILKDFESKLKLRKNKVSERRNSLKKNSKFEYRYKVQAKRHQTECAEKQNFQFQKKFQGLWNQNASRMKNYITGGYTDEKQDYSDFCDIEEYRRLKNNFKTFQQIYNNIKEDKDNPIGKVNKTDFKQPNILEVVSAMEKQHELLASKPF